MNTVFLNAKGNIGDELIVRVPRVGNEHPRGRSKRLQGRRAHQPRAMPDSRS
jgi:hypothetical protein